MITKPKDGKFSDVSDEQLIAKFQQGDVQAYDVLVRRYKDQLLNFIYRFVGNRSDAEDIVQETLLRVYKNKHMYKEIAKFSTWVYTIAGNLAKTELRKRKRRKVVSISDMGFEDKEYEIEDEMANTERDANSALTEKIIQDAIDDLPARFKEVIVLRDIQESVQKHFVPLRFDHVAQEQYCHFIRSFVLGGQIICRYQQLR